MPVRMVSVPGRAPTLDELLRARFGELTPLEIEVERWPVRIQREILDLAHGRWLWSEAAKRRWELRDAAARSSLGARAKRTLKKVAALPFASSVGLELPSRSDRELSRRLRRHDRWVDYMKARRPSLVFDGLHIHNVVSTPPVRAAQWAGIPTAAFLFSWDNLTSQGRMMPTYDWYLVWNEAIKQDLLRIYPRTAAERVLVTGTPQFDFHFRPEFTLSREEICARVGADPARPIVLYSTGIQVPMPEEPRIVEGVARALQQVRGVPDPQLLVRVYPKDLSGRFDALRAQAVPDVLFPPVPWERRWLTPRLEDCSLLTSTLRHCALGINVASTVSLELCMFDKPGQHRLRPARLRRPPDQLRALLSLRSLQAGGRLRCGRGDPRRGRARSGATGGVSMTPASARPSDGTARALLRHDARRPLGRARRPGLAGDGERISRISVVTPTWRRPTGRRVAVRETTNPRGRAGA